ncbi:MAG: sodium:solute symporter family protein [Planctomycetaceae bacterium]
MTLTALDWAIVVSYIVVTLGIGFGFSKRAGGSLNEFFISGRSLPWWVAGTSMVATTFAADTPLAVTGIVIKNGLAGNWVWWAFALGGMITVFVYSRLWRRSEVVTDVEFVELRYGGKPAAALRGIRAVYVALIVNAIVIGWVCGAMITFFDSTVFPSPPPSTEYATVQKIEVADRTDEDRVVIEEHASQQAAVASRQWWLLIGCLVVVGLYASLSGMWGVAITDVIQFVLAITGCILLAVVAVKHVGGADALRDKVSEQFGGGEQALSFLPSFTGENKWMPLHAFLIMATMQWWATWYPGAEPGGGGYVVQRMASCKDERHSLLATLWFQLCHYCLRPWPWVLVGFVALVMYPELRQDHVAGLEPGKFTEAGRLVLDPGAGYPMVIRDLAPSGLRGLMLVTFFAAFMSTISTQMNWGASYLVKDVYQRFIKPEASDRHYANASRVASVIVLFGGGVATWLMKDFSIDTIWNILLALGAGTGAVFMLRWFWWRINAWTEIAGMVASLVFFLIIGVGEKSLPTEVFVVETAQVKIALVAGLSIVTWLVVTFATAPESEAVLTAFYRKIRPAGSGWKPIAEACPDVTSPDRLVLSILAAIASSILIYSVLPLTGYVVFGAYQSAAIAAGIAVVSGVVTVLLVRKLAK